MQHTVITIEHVRFDVRYTIDEFGAVEIAAIDAGDQDVQLLLAEWVLKRIEREVQAEEALMALWLTEEARIDAHIAARSSASSHSGVMA